MEKRKVSGGGGEFFPWLGLGGGGGGERRLGGGGGRSPKRTVSHQGEGGDAGGRKQILAEEGGRALPCGWRGRIREHRTSYPETVIGFLEEERGKGRRLQGLELRVRGAQVCASAQTSGNIAAQSSGQKKGGAREVWTKKAHARSNFQLERFCPTTGRRTLLKKMENPKARERVKGRSEGGKGVCLKGALGIDWGCGEGKCGGKPTCVAFHQGKAGVTTRIKTFLN